MNYADLIASVIQVGGGRGFVVGGEGERYVITAAHCLPTFPPCASTSGLEERTYARLLGPIGADPMVWAECLFLDPISDLAVLGSPDNQALGEEAGAYAALVTGAVALRLAAPSLSRQRVSLALPSGEPVEIGRPPEWKGAGFMLSIERHWFRCEVTAFGRALWISGAEEDIRGGMSG